MVLATILSKWFTFYDFVFCWDEWLIWILLNFFNTSSLNRDLSAAVDENWILSDVDVKFELFNVFWICPGVHGEWLSEGYHVSSVLISNEIRNKSPFLSSVTLLFSSVDIDTVDAFLVSSFILSILLSFLAVKYFLSSSIHVLHVLNKFGWNLSFK